jgi:hypothetical protein
MSKHLEPLVAGSTVAGGTCSTAAGGWTSPAAPRACGSGCWASSRLADCTAGGTGPAHDDEDADAADDADEAEEATSVACEGSAAGPCWSCRVGAGRDGGGDCAWAPACSCCCGGFFVVMV